MLLDDEGVNTLTFRLPAVYPITDVRLSGLSHVEQVRQFIAGGAKLVQLREKSAPAQEFYEAALAVMNIAREMGVSVIINDRVDIALAVKAHGVHLGQDDLPPEEARRLLGGSALIGLSTHDIEQAERASRAPIDYIAIGPIFATRTKRDAAPTVGLNGLAAVRHALPQIPLVAIGGIDRENITSVISAGADSAAVISELFSPADDIAANFSAFQAAAVNKQAKQS
ncbi:MAG: thiamine phosphate synthase [Acidobacteria bacterium]|nr:thiamine phosphate synthase [Acidobacteriota bacterium]